MTYRHLTRLLCAALLLVTGSLSAQIALDDPERVSIHVAGQDLLMIEGVQIAGRSMRVYLAGSPDGTWQVTSMEPLTSGMLPQNLVLDAARLSIDETGALRIDDIFVDDSFYAGTIRFDESYERVREYRFAPTPAPLAADNPLVARLAELYGIGASAGAPTSGAREPDLTPEPPESPASVEPAEGQEPPTPEAPRDPAETDSAAGGDGGGGDTVDRAVQRILNHIDGVERAGAERISALEAGLEERLTGIEERLEALLDRGEALENRMDTLADRGASIETRLASLESDARAAGSLLERVARSAGGGSSAPAAAPNVPGVDASAPTLSLARARGEFARSELLDPAEGAVVRGRWLFPEQGRTVQADAAERFGKLELVYQQDSRPALYRLMGRALDPGWAGLGLHIAVNGVERPRGYGHGRSILVWLTRDAEVYGTDATFLEVYVSYDDVTMNRVAQAALDSNLADTHALEVLFDPGAGILTAAVNGVEYLRYRLSVPQGASMELALRGLGRVELSDVEARSR